jgi:hypothetical protein
MGFQPMLAVKKPGNTADQNDLSHDTVRTG